MASSMTKKIYLGKPLRVPLVKVVSNLRILGQCRQRGKDSNKFKRIIADKNQAASATKDTLVKAATQL